MRISTIYAIFSGKSGIIIFYLKSNIYNYLATYPLLRGPFLYKICRFLNQAETLDSYFLMLFTSIPSLRILCQRLLWLIPRSSVARD